MFDNFLTWKAHVDCVCKKIHVANRVNILGRIRSCLTREALVLVYTVIRLFSQFFITVMSHSVALQQQDQTDCSASKTDLPVYLHVALAHPRQWNVCAGFQFTQAFLS